MRAALLHKLAQLEKAAQPTTGPRLIVIRLAEHGDDDVIGAHMKPGSTNSYTVDRVAGERLEMFFNRLEALASPGETVCAMLRYANADA